MQLSLGRLMDSLESSPIELESVESSETDWVPSLSAAASANGSSLNSLWISAGAMSGGDDTGLEVADVTGKSQSFAYPGYTPTHSGGGGGPGSSPMMYDPFIFVLKGTKA